MLFCQVLPWGSWKLAGSERTSRAQWQGVRVTRQVLCQLGLESVLHSCAAPLLQHLRAGGGAGLTLLTGQHTTTKGLTLRT